MTDSNKVLRQLQESVLGRSLGTTHLQQLVDRAALATAAAGSVVFAEGDPADVMRIVCSGCVALDMHVPSRGSVRILTVGPRDLLGWSALIGDGSMSATATVTENAEFLEFSAEALQALCAADAELGRTLNLQVARALAQRLSQTRLQLLDLFAETEPQVPSASGKAKA